MPRKPSQIQTFRAAAPTRQAAGTVRSPRKYGHRSSVTVHAPLDVALKLRLRRLNWRRHWVILRSGDAKPLAEEIDKILDEGVPSELVERHLIDTARQHGMSKDVVSLLFRWTTLQRQRRHLARVTSKLTGAARSTILYGVLARARRLQELRVGMTKAWRSMPLKARARLHQATPDIRFRCGLDPFDRHLVSGWPVTRSVGIEDETPRLEWARRAEKAALAYYRALGQEVEDVSIQQIDTGSLDWTTLDLRADGRPLDVKNVRCSREDRFAEHRWKQKRHGTVDVAIVGVVSMLESSDSIVAGELEARDVDRFRSSIETFEWGPRISTGKRNWFTFAPGWLLEYPAAHYDSMPDWGDVTRRWMGVSADLKVDVPPWIFGLAASRSPTLDGSSIETEFLRSVRRHFRHFGLSRRSIFWFVLVYMLSCTRDPEAADKLNDHLFPDGAKDYPLGLFDPRKYVWSLVQTLKQMIESNRSLFQSVSHLHLSGLGILQAFTGDQWITILAYCGNCGKCPIFLGKSHTTHEHERYGNGSCRSCPCDSRRLVCDDCGSCSGRCDQGIRYATARDARAAAREFPGWRAIRNTLYPPY